MRHKNRYYIREVQQLNLILSQFCLVPTYILWRICPMQELLSHRNLKTRTQQWNCGLNQRVVGRRLCERLDCATVS
jgi:hypothetical protein